MKIPCVRLPRQPVESTFPWVPRVKGSNEPFSAYNQLASKKKRELLSSELPIERFFPFALLALILLFIEDLTPSGRKN